MIALIVAITLTATYLYIGFRYIAPPFVSRNVASFIADCPTLATDPRHIEEERREQAGFAVPLALVWPFYLLGRLLVGKIADLAPPTDYELKRRLAERDKHIADLERELGIRRRGDVP